MLSRPAMTKVLPYQSSARVVTLERSSVVLEPNNFSCSVFQRRLRQGSEIALVFIPDLRGGFGGFENLGPAESLDQEPLILGGLHDETAGLLPQRRQEQQIGTHHQQECEQGNDREGRAVGQHHRERHQGDEELAGEAEHHIADQTIDAVDIADSAHNFAAAVAVEIGHRQPQQLMAVLEQHPELQALGEMAHEMALQQGDQVAEDEQQ